MSEYSKWNMELNMESAFYDAYHGNPVPKGTFQLKMKLLGAVKYLR